MRVLWATCDALVTPRPLGPLLDVARLTGGELRARVDDRAQPHDVATALMAELEAPAPTVLVLEDVHWADDATLDVVRLLARRMDTIPALLVLSYREEQLYRTHPLRLLLGELPTRGVTRIELQGLSRAAVATLAEPSAVDAEELYERTGGNPFFVTEALAAETERVPSTVRDAVLARAARLSPDARGLLDAAAVVPQRAEVWLLEALTEGALDSLDECLSSRMLRTEADGVAFRHELARLAIEESVSSGTRVTLHRRALAALAEPAIGARDLARLAHHAEAAGDTDAVLRYAPAAAEHASIVGSPREAQNQYGRALRFADGLLPEDRADLLERFGTVGELTDMRQEAMDAFEEAFAIPEVRGDLLKQGEVLFRHSGLLGCAGRLPEARALSHEAVRLLEQGPPGRDLALAYCGMAGMAMLADEHAETIEWGCRAIELAERVAADEALVRALTYVGTVELTVGQDDEVALAKLERALDVALAANLPARAGTVYINIAGEFAKRQEWPLAEGYLRAGIRYCREHGLEPWVRSLEAIQAEMELTQGRWDAAADAAAAILDTSGPLSAEPRHSALSCSLSCEHVAATPSAGPCSTRHARSPSPQANSR